MTGKCIKILFLSAVIMISTLSCSRDISGDDTFVQNFKAQLQQVMDDQFVLNGEAGVALEDVIQFSLEVNGDVKDNTFFDPANITLEDDLFNVIEGTFTLTGIDILVFTPSCNGEPCSLAPNTTYTLTVTNWPGPVSDITIIFTTGAAIGDTDAPTVTISSHKDNDPAVDTITLMADVTDASTFWVEFYVDGMLTGFLNTPTTGNSFNFNLNTHDYENSINHTITYRATDFFWNTVDVSVILFFNNPELCNDTLDNDGDTLTDFPADPGCTSATDSLELGTNECDDGVDNDLDTFTDFPGDLGCTDPADTSELSTIECDDNIDNDGDTYIDYPSDNGCFGIADDNEYASNQCDDGVDNDADTFIDYPNDPECLSKSGNMEYPNTECNDGIDNDGDTLKDYYPVPEGKDGGAGVFGLDDDSANGVDDAGELYKYWIGSDDPDPGCTGYGDTSEYGTVECDDNIDNDGDTAVDYSPDQGCDNLVDTNELGTNECDDGIDNDGDTAIDFPDDGDCINAADTQELGVVAAPTPFITNDLVAGTGVVFSTLNETNFPPVAALEVHAWDPVTNPTCNLSNLWCQMGKFWFILYTDGTNNGTYSGTAMLRFDNAGPPAPLTIPAGETVTLNTTSDGSVIAYLPAITIAPGQHLLLYVEASGATFYASSTLAPVANSVPPDLTPTTAFADWVTYLAEPVP